MYAHRDAARSCREPRQLLKKAAGTLSYRDALTKSAPASRPFGVSTACSMTALSKVKRNTEPSERKYLVETQAQACWRRLQTASGMHVWHEGGC